MDNNRVSDIYQNYFDELSQIKPSDATEHTNRSKLETLFIRIAEEAKLKLQVISEPKRDRIHGAPDYLIKKGESNIGYVENKKIEVEDLTAVIKSAQIKKYNELSQNILVTNYHEFIWISKKEVKLRERLFLSHDLGERKFKLSQERIEKVDYLIRSFLSQEAEGIGKPQRLAETLAVRTKYLKDILLEELERQEKEHKVGKLIQLFATFKRHVLHILTLEEFADAFAQNLAYGLFLAKLNAGSKEINLYNAKGFIPRSFELIAELVDFLDELHRDEYAETKFFVEEILSILNNLNLQEIRSSLFYHSVRSHTLFGEDVFSWRDPFVYFYELFLKKYDKELRIRSGAFYTPPPVVNFIVKSVNGILQDSFGIADGLGDRKKVTVLDFATGTGTFILEVFQQVLDALPKHSGKKDDVIREHLLKNIYGFEYLIAPYTIAHLKLSQYLKEKGYTLGSKERLQVFLTNTLEMGEKHSTLPYLPALTTETELSQEVKDKPILVIIGNPPYYYKSKNPSYKVVKEKITKKDGTEKTVKKKVLTDIGKLVNDYYYIEGKATPSGKKIKEKNPKGLQDDYVKFIRFAQSKMENVEEGIVGIITNNAFLRNPTFPGMRKSLLNVFDQLHFIDLHGNYQQKETTPKGAPDENVFDIRNAGVAISILVKKKGLRKQILHYDLWGKRKVKYEYLVNHDVKHMQGANKEKVTPKAPSYSFVPEDQGLKEQFNSYLSIKEIFKLGQEGVKTHRDHFVIDRSLDVLKRRINDFIDTALTDEQIREKYDLEDSGTWQLSKARYELRKLNKSEILASYRKIQYRPFDYRWVFYREELIDRNRHETVQHLLATEKNISLLSVRQFAYNVQDFCYSFVSRVMADNRTFVSNKGTCLMYPLYHFNDGVKSVNFSEKFKELLKRQGYENPLDVFNYLYAILYSPTYRRKYFEPLQTDYPRIPITSDKKLFSKLSKLGNDLIAAQLLEKSLPSDIGVFIGKGTNLVQDPIFVSKGKYGQLYINDQKYFDKVPLEVYNFVVGGYKVLESYLNHKDRKGTVLSLDEVDTFENIIRVLAFTIEQMKKIDELTKKWI